MIKTCGVNDSTTKRKIISNLVKHTSCEIITTCSGEALIAALMSKYSFDLVIDDIVIDGMNGHEVFPKIKDDPNTKFDSVQRMRQGADTLTTKLFAKELISTIRQLLKG